MVNPNYFGAMMVQYGQVDAARHRRARDRRASGLRPLHPAHQAAAETTSISSCMMLDLSNKRYGERGVMFFADCAVIPEPNVEQLANIAVQTGTICRQLTGNKPRIAMLSFSTKGSAKLPARRKRSPPPPRSPGRRPRTSAWRWRSMASCRPIPRCCRTSPRARRPPASSPARPTCSSSPTSTRATSRVKLVQYLAGAETYGQILLGLSKPCADLSRGATEDDILGVAAILGLQAIEYPQTLPRRRRRFE